jgi:hypothetical protein
MSDRAHIEKSIEAILELRAVVGFLGQKKQKSWWDCSLLDSTGIRFLETTFPRSARAAAFNSTSEAACRIHDMALGKIGLFHLFRFPVFIEEFLQERLAAFSISPAFNAVLDFGSAMERLKQIAGVEIKAPSGPVQVGMEQKILTQTSIHELAAHYLSAFDQGIQCFPYFGTSKTNG